MKFTKNIYLLLIFTCFCFTCQSEITYNGKEPVDLKKIKLVLFDFSCFVIDQVPLFKQMADEFREKYPQIPEFTENEIKNTVADKNLREYVTKGLGLSILKTLSNYSRVKEMSKEYIENTPFLEKTKKILIQISDRYEIGMLTFSSEDTVKEVLKREEFEKVVTKTFILSKWCFFAKTKAIKDVLRSDYKLDQVLYIGDKREEIEHYASAGIKTCAVSWGTNSLEFMRAGEHPPTISITEPEELFQILPACQTN